jgi:hypothetical protein
MDGVFIQDLTGASTFDVEPLLFFRFRRGMDGCEQAFSGRILYHLGDSEVVD